MGVGLTSDETDFSSAQLGMAPPAAGTVRCCSYVKGWKMTDVSFLLRSQNLRTMSKQVKGKSEPFLKEGQRWGKALDCREKLLQNTPQPSAKRLSDTWDLTVASSSIL